MKTKLTFGIMMVLILAVTTLSWAGHRHGKKHHRDNGPMEFIQRLDLSTEQQNQVDTIMESHREAQQTLGKDLRNARKELQKAILSDTFNETAIRSASRTISSNMEEMAVLRGKIYSEVRAVLTPEQIEQLSNIHKCQDAYRKCKEQNIAPIQDQDVEMP